MDIFSTVIYYNVLFWKSLENLQILGIRLFTYILKLIGFGGPRKIYSLLHWLQLETLCNKSW